MVKKLKTGVAYHGNRILKHVEEDMKDISARNMNTVLHMFTHNDWDRHLGVMKNIFDISKENGLEVWVDNWGLGGPPGDKSHFLQYHPESHQVLSDGTREPVRSCFNSEAFLKFTYDWIDAVAECGGQKIFWDEPHLIEKDVNGKKVFSCCCDTCKKLFEEEYNKPMPAELTDEVLKFRMDSINSYFEKVTSHAASKGIENIVCVMLHTLDHTNGLVNIPALSNFGIDPYWRCDGNWDKEKKCRIQSPYDYVYDNTKNFTDVAKKAGKDSHVWIQAFGIPAGEEEDIFYATDAAYDAGARTILAWSFRGAESNTYKSERCDYLWNIIGEAMRRIKDRNLDEIRNEFYSKKNN